MDLKQVSNLLGDPRDKRHILYLFDEFSRMTKGCVVRNKESKEIGDKVLKEWCLNGLGYPSKFFFTDNGGEFGGDILNDIARKTGV